MMDLVPLGCRFQVQGQILREQVAAHHSIGLQPSISKLRGAWTVCEEGMMKSLVNVPKEWP